MAENLALGDLQVDQLSLKTVVRAGSQMSKHGVSSRFEILRDWDAVKDRDDNLAVGPGESGCQPAASFSCHRPFRPSILPLNKQAEPQP